MPPIILPAVVVEYTPDLMAADLVTATGTILLWAAAGIGAAVSLMAVWIGIRKGFGFFRGLGR